MIKNKAFTLIELLVVIAIIGVLATLAIVSLQQARQNARNAKRVADLRQMQTALELYFNENNSYPSAAEFEVGSPLISFSTGKILMQQIPSAPAVADADCLTSDYNYTANEDNSSYKLKTCISKDINNLPAGVITATPNSLGYLDPCYNQTEFTDTRDGTTYQIVAIGNQCWMADNLKYLPDGISMSPAIEGSTTLPHYYVYGYEGYNVEEAKATANYNTYGALYNWVATMDWDGITPATAAELEGAQGICPAGWYVPTDEDWKTLEGTVDSVYEIGDSEWDQGHTWRGLDAGIKLKTASWGGDNSFGFSALPAGVRIASGSFSGIHMVLYPWSSSASPSAWSRYLRSTANSIARYSYDYSLGFSVRCLKN